MTDIQWGRVDWTTAVEAVAMDGRIAAVYAVEPINHGMALIKIDESEDKEWYAYANGTVRDGGWVVRNPPQQTPTPDVVGIAPELVERMEVLVRRMAEQSEKHGWMNSNYVEARAILALLPEPVDGDGPDIAEARELGARLCDVMHLPGLAQGYRDGGFDKEASALRSFLLDLGMPK